jgi:S-DNA-T family DNA segregation ATPase FtsK/SpoIIIE
VSAVFDTQSSRADAIPSHLVENVGFNGCFAAKSWRSNDGFLGDGSFAAGIRATDLRFNVDRGTMVATGASEELFEIVRTFFIKVDDDAGWDQATEIIERAMDQLDPRTPANGVRATPAEAPVKRDLLEDVAEVLGNERMNAADVPPMLRKLAPRWAPYKTLDGRSMRTQLDKKYGVKVVTTGNRHPLDPVAIREALARQSTRDLDE